MLRPLFVTGSLVHGGAERHSITVMNRLAERGHQCHAAYVKHDVSQLSRIRLPKGNSVHCLGAKGFFDSGAIANFGDHLRRIKPSVIVAANGYALMYASLARWTSGLRVPLMVTYHTTQLLGAKEQVKMLLHRPFFWNADRAVFVCHMQQRYCSRRLVRGRSNEVIYNGVDIEHFRDTWSGSQRLQQRRELGLPDEDYVIGISAVMRPEKNHVQLVDALGRLRDQGISARILMIGDGVTRPQIEARARQVGVADRIHITGLHQEVRPYLAACDVVALCSIGIETFSLAALEAMAMSRPVIHSNLGGAAEMITHEHNGLIFEAHDTPGLVRCLAQLSDHTLARRMGHQARRTVEARFSERSMVDRYERSLLNLCGEGGRRARVASAA
jgi:glycosyltransferase involved in cell wall biosynthesis